MTFWHALSLHFFRVSAALHNCQDRCRINSSRRYFLDGHRHKDALDAARHFADHVIDVAPDISRHPAGALYLCLTPALPIFARGEFCGHVHRESLDAKARHQSLLQALAIIISFYGILLKRLAKISLMAQYKRSLNARHEMDADTAASHFLLIKIARGVLSVDAVSDNSCL